jgi:hypothetical protein
MILSAIEHLRAQHPGRDLSPPRLDASPAERAFYVAGHKPLEPSVSNAPAWVVGTDHGASAASR